MKARLRLWLPLLLCAWSAACSCSSTPSSTGPAKTSEIAPAVAPSRIDALLHAAWEKEGLTPAETAGDATFLRRATLDLFGALPTPDEARAFASDAAPDKRARLVDRMLGDPRFSERFAVVWTDLLLGETRPAQGVDRAAFRSWLKKRMEDRAPWDRVVREIVSGTGRNSPGGTLRERAVAAHADSSEPESEDVHGNVNYLLRYRGAVEDLTGKTAKTFLGVQIQCAQCHDHKTEAWTQDQFKGFAASFIKTRAVPAEGRQKGEMRLLEVRDVPRAKLGRRATESQRAIAKVAPRALDGTALDKKEPRKALAEWITAKQNPTFAKAFVNRTWAMLLGSGFVNPVDDLRPGNPPALPELFDALAQGFADSGYDVRALVRTICLSDAYQRKAGKNAALWSSFAVRPLPAEVLFDAIVTAAGLRPVIEDIMGERAELVRARNRQRFVLLLDVDEDAGEHRFEGSIGHALLLSNGSVTRVAARAIKGGTLIDAIRAKGGDDATLNNLYSRTLSRPPTAEERSAWKEFLADAGGADRDKNRPKAPKPAKGDPLARLDKRLKSQAATPRERAYEDIFWALLNSSEMAMQH